MSTRLFCVKMFTCMRRLFSFNSYAYDFRNNCTNYSNSTSFSPTLASECKSQHQRRITSPLRLLWHGVKQIYYEYCSNTSIHGIQYLGERRPLKEKLFWITIFLISIWCCSNLINSIYSKWNETPVIVSFSEKTTPVWNIPFPAVTICSETKRILKKEGMTYAKFYEMLNNYIELQQPISTANLTTVELEEFVTLLHICSTQIIEEGMPILLNYPVDHLTLLDNMTPTFERYFTICKWLKFIGDCRELFLKTYTEEGICYTFNGLSPKDLYRPEVFQYQRALNQSKHARQHRIIPNRKVMWSLQSGYQSGSGFQTYPLRVLSSGARAGLFIALQSFKQETDYACRGPVQGFKVLLHSPDDFPQVSKQFVRIPMGKEVLIAIKPNMITTSPSIAAYAPQRRQCFLEQERHLRFFRSYTQGNCELECLANFTLQKCGCVKFSMPRTLDMPVCNESKIYCYDSAEDEMLMHEFSQGLRESSFNYRGQTDCNCLPACTSLVYNTEISQGSFDLQQLLDAAGDTEYMSENDGAQMSRLSIYFKESQFITSKRSELYGSSDFLANCGGILGLFMGFSFLSAIEMVYHFTLRLWSTLKVMHKGVSK